MKLSTLFNWRFILLLQLTWFPWILLAPKTEYAPPADVTEEQGELIRWKQDEVEIEVSIEELDIEETKEAQLQSLGIFRLTAYCPCKSCSSDYGTQTSTGAVATEGRTIAVDPRVIPYGTVVVIAGREYVAEDCGGAIKGNDIDIYFDTHDEVDEFGVHYADVFVR